MSDQNTYKMIDITDGHGLWNRFFTVHSLVIIGSKEEDGSYNMAPKHLAMPLGFGPYFGFMGTERKKTYHNVQREKTFTVSYPKPDQVIISSLMASRREEDDSKPIIDKVPTIDAKKVEGKFLKDAYLQLECRLSQTIGQFDEWEMMVGDVVAAYVHKDALRTEGDDTDDANLIRNAPLLGYLHPDRFSVIEESNAFPLPKDFKR